MTTPVVLGIDIGTSAVKGALWTADGRMLASRRSSLAVSRPQPGWAEHDAESGWWDGICRITAGLAEQYPRWDRRLAGIGISGLCPAVVPMDGDGRVQRPAILYSIDRRAHRELAVLTDRYDQATAVARSGQALGPQNIVAKMMWLRDNEPDLWQRTTRVLGSTGYAVHRLTGQYWLDHFSAADGGIGYHLADRAWDTDVFESQGIDPRVLPPLRWPTEIAGAVSDTAAAATGLPQDTPVAVGTGDALADLMGVPGDHRPGTGAILYGTSISTMIHATAPSTADGVVTVPGWQPDQLVHSAVLSSGVGVLEWWGRLLGVPWDDRWADRLDETVAGSEPGDDGLLHLPYLTGRRSGQAATGRLHDQGALLGMGIGHQRADVLRAVITGLAHALRYELDGSVTDGTLLAEGAGARSRALVQAVTDVCGFDQVRSDRAAGVARGAARVAAIATGLVDGRSNDWPADGELIRRSAGSAERSAAQQQRFRAAVAGLDRTT